MGLTILNKGERASALFFLCQNSRAISRPPVRERAGRILRNASIQEFPICFPGNMHNSRYPVLCNISLVKICFKFNTFSASMVYSSYKVEREHKVSKVSDKSSEREKNFLQVLKNLLTNR